MFQILYTLVNKKDYILHIILSLLALIFGIIYEHFSHGVYSIFMMYAFIIPLLLGFIVLYILNILNIKINVLSLNLYHSMIFTLLLGSIFKGFLDIYGTTNNLVYVYIYASIVLFIVSIIINFMKDKN